MQPARFKLHAEERTCNPVQRPNFRGGGAESAGQERKDEPRAHSSTARTSGPSRGIHCYTCSCPLLSNKKIVKARFKNDCSWRP
jgi:hypothetical protein